MSASGVTYSLDVTAFYCGQMNGVIYAIAGDDFIGQLDWQKYGGDVLIAWIEVDESHRRNGVGSGLVQRLRDEFPDEQINWGYTTTDGTALREHLEEYGQ